MSVQFRGTSKSQDGRFGDKMDKLRNTMNFSRVLKKKIDFSKIRLSVLKEWITNRAIESLGCEDEIVINYIFCMLEGDDPNPKDMQIYLTGFMEEDARFFMKDLWLLLDEAQKSPNGIPKRLIEKEKEEIRKEKELKEKIGETIRERMVVEKEMKLTGSKRKRENLVVLEEEKKRDEEELRRRKRRKLDDNN